MCPRNPNPDHAEFGKPGELIQVRLSLKVLADIGLVGRPNAGKSTFLSRVSRAHPKIADYPFTTTKPHLGIVKPASGRESFVMADIPGLVEGSHEGKGLGIRFLRHIERTKVLAIMIEASEEDPVKEANTLLAELKEYSPLLAEKPKCCILTKNDLVQGDEIKSLPKGWLNMSAITGDNVEKVLATFSKLLEKEKAPEEREPWRP